MRPQPMLTFLLLPPAYFLILVETSDTPWFRITTKDWSNIQDDVPFEIAWNVSDPDREPFWTLDFGLIATWTSPPVPVDSWTIHSQLSYVWVPSMSAIRKNIENADWRGFSPSTLPEQYQIMMMWKGSSYVAYGYSPTFAIVNKQKATETATSAPTSTSNRAETAALTPQSIPEPEAKSQPNSTGQTTSSKIGIGLGAGIGGALVLSVAGWCIYRRGKKAALQELTKHTVDQNGDAMWTGKPELSGKGKDPNDAASKGSSLICCRQIHQEGKGKEDSPSRSVGKPADAEVGNTPDGSSQPGTKEREDVKIEAGSAC
ncbi:hypothetical protein V8F33_012384 [Rhypophila sp. PSN 637]